MIDIKRILTLFLFYLTRSTTNLNSSIYVQVKKFVIYLVIISFWKVEQPIQHVLYRFP